MARPRPALAITFGILTLAAAFLFLICGTCGAIGSLTTTKNTLVVNGRDVTPDYEAHMNREVPAYLPIRIIDVVMRFVVALGFLGAGIGLLMVVRWGQLATVAIALLSIFHLLLTALWQVVFIGPAKAEFLQIVPLLNLGFIAKAETAWVVIWSILFIILDLVLIVGLVLPSSWRMFGPYVEEEPAEAEDEENRSPRSGRRRPSRQDDDDDYRD